MWNSIDGIDALKYHKGAIVTLLVIIKHLGNINCKIVG